MARPEFAHVALLAEAIQALQPGTSTGELKRRSYLVASAGLTGREDDFVDRLAAGQVSYLEGRLRAVKGRVAARARWPDSRRGIDRFAPGLDASLDVVREEIKQVGGITAEHEAELGRLPRDPKNHPPTGE